MSTVLEITQLDDGDIVLREADSEGEPLIRIRFSGEVKDMVGAELVGIAEAMIDAATEFLGSEPVEEEHPESAETDPPPVIH